MHASRSSKTRGLLSKAVRALQAGSTRKTKKSKRSSRNTCMRGCRRLMRGGLKWMASSRITWAPWTSRRPWRIAEKRDMIDGAHLLAGQGRVVGATRRCIRAMHLPPRRRHVITNKRMKCRCQKRGVDGGMQRKQTRLGTLGPALELHASCEGHARHFRQPLPDARPSVAPQPS